MFYFSFLHFPLSGPVPTNISLPIIPCMIVYVTNNKEPWTLNLEHGCLRSTMQRDAEPDFTKCDMFLGERLCWPWNNIIINQSDLKNKFFYAFLWKKCI